jgi:N6-L-threonylcarbamoyladenine synthase
MTPAQSNCIFGIETSCDETAASLINSQGSVLSNIVFSQIPLHRPYAGVVPEIASRNHVLYLPEIIKETLKSSGKEYSDIKTISVTYGPGLASSLLVGLSAAKGLAMSLNKNLILINHLEGHLFSPFIGKPMRIYSCCPFISLIVSGGHTCLLKVNAPGNYQLLGTTLDDAAGEAFDKGAVLLGLNYPGGPAIEQASIGGNQEYVKFPRPKIGKQTPTGSLNRDYCFSFSGLKTALLYYLKKQSGQKIIKHINDIAASYQETITDILISRLQLALHQQNVRFFSVVGGVAVNKRLRQKLKDLEQSTDSELMLAEKQYCTDNAAMIATSAWYNTGITGEQAWSTDVCPSLRLSPSVA